MAKTPTSSSKKPKKTAPPKKAHSEAAPVEAPPAATDPATAVRRSIPGSFRLVKQAFLVLKGNWQVFLGIALLYAALNVLLIQGLHATSSVTDLKHTLEQVPTSGAGHIADGVSLVTSLIGASSTNVSPTAGAYQFVLAVVVSLAVIWSLREIYAQRAVEFRDGFYKGMTPFITFLLVLLMVVVHLLPFAVGATFYSIITANAIATGLLQQTIFMVMFLGLSLVSLYLLCSSLFALYIVTLPGMTPWAALRSARDLVAGRRWTVMRKIVFLPFFLLFASIVLLLPFVMFLTVTAPWVFMAVVAAMLIFLHSYMYALYRSLL
jgi:hypothetical protein